MYFVHTWIIIILPFSFFNGSLSKKKIVKVTEDDIYDKLLEILKVSEKFVLAKVQHSNRTNGIPTSRLKFY